MSYADDVLDSPNVQVAVDMKQKYRLTFDQMHALAWHLGLEQMAGRIKHDEHRKMVAAKWCKSPPPAHEPRPVETMAEAAAKVDAAIKQFFERQVSLGADIQEIVERRRSDLYE